MSGLTDGTVPAPAHRQLADTNRTLAADTEALLLSRCFLAGAGAGLLVLVFVLLGGAWSLLQTAPAGEMYDAQARSLLDGRWDVPREVAGIEAFAFDGRTYIYFGPFPALLRMPLFLVTDRFDGRLGQLSIIAAVSLGFWATSRIVEELLHRVPPPPSSGLLPRVAFVTFGLVLAGGSVVTYVAHRGDVYNEAIAWGLATALASIAALVRALRTGSTRYLFAAGAFGAVALQSRITMGLSAVAPLGLVLAASFATRTREVFGISRLFVARHLRVALAVATLLPVALFVGVQMLKFGTLFVRPSDHLVNQEHPQFATYLSRHGDTYVSPAFVPTNVLNLTVWPSAMRFGGSFPWIRPVDMEFGAYVGSPLFLGRAWAGSLASTQSLIFAFGCIGTSVLCLPGLMTRLRRGHAGPLQTTGRACADLRLVVLGALAGFVGTLAYSYQYHRFLADSFPAVVLLAVVGCATLPRLVATLRAARVGVALMVALATWSVAVNVSTALVAQTERAWAPTPPAFRRLIGIGDAFGSSYRIVDLDLHAPMPPPAAIGDLARIGDCDALFAAAGAEGFAPIWWPVELGPRFTRTLQVDVGSLPIGETELVADTEGGSGSRVALDVDQDRAAAVVLGSGGSSTRQPITGDRARVTLEVSPVWAALAVDVQDRTHSLPWHGSLPGGGLDRPPAVEDLGGDGVSLCSGLSSLSASFAMML